MSTPESNETPTPLHGDRYSMPKPVTSICTARFTNLVSCAADVYSGRSMRLKHVCARGKGASVSAMPLRQNRWMPLCPCSAAKPWTGTPEVPAGCGGQHAARVRGVQAARAC